MKAILNKYSIFAAIVLFLLFIAAATVNPTARYSSKVENNGIHIEFNTDNADTLKTGADTAFIYTNQKMYSKWQARWNLRATNITGTTGITAYVQERDYMGATDDWKNVDTMTISGLTSAATAYDADSQAEVEGIEQRLYILASGSNQVSLYKASVTYKKSGE